MIAVISVTTLAALCFIVGWIIEYIRNFIEMVYARECLIQTIDQIIKMVRYQQIILSELGIPYKSKINRQNFNDVILSVHKSIIRAYWDLELKKDKVSDKHYVGLSMSYTDNINALNLLLEEYNIYNVRYGYAKDKCHLINTMFPDYPFLNSDIQYRLDNGIPGTGAFAK